MSVTVKQAGRLGNIMFKIACGCSVAKDNKVNFRSPPDFEQGKYFKLNYQDFGNNEDPIFSWQDPGFHYTPVKYQGPMTLDGYFQSEKYFKHNEDYIKNEIFAMKNIEPDERFARFNEENPNARKVAVHVRRGDYLTLPYHHPVLPIEFYHQAFKKFENQEFFVFSDDIEWCKENFPSNFNFMDGNGPIVDFYTMSLCDDFIIANSSFSWWAAWLSNDESKRVISPDPFKNWFGVAYSHYDMKDIIPEQWKTIEV